MQRHGAAIRRLQWLLVLFYGVLVVVPAFLPLPDETARVFNHLTQFAQFMFWGLWWPFVLLSMVVLGRAWCGLLCPEGTLTEWASRHGRQQAIPHWLRWGGWPFVAFACTTVYGQLVSVYQYPKAVLLVLGGSTLAAVVVGYLYGREKRVWCRYLCPVNGVFGLLAKLAPVHFKVDADHWRGSYQPPQGVIGLQPVNCAPLLPLRKMQGASDCHMCGRCSGHRDAITLSLRSPNHEIVHLDGQLATGWQAVMVLYGLLGIAIGAFLWTSDPRFVTVRQAIAEWLVEHDLLWPFNENAPWWLLTHYPDQRDVFNWLDGAWVLGYIGGVGLLLGSGLGLLVAGATRLAGSWRRQHFVQLCQALVPLAGCGVFLGLSALTISLLKIEGVPVDWANDVRLVLLVASSLWSLWLAQGILAVQGVSVLRRAAALLPVMAAVALVDGLWWLRFWVW